MVVWRNGMGEVAETWEAVVQAQVIDNPVLCCDGRHGVERKESPHGNKEVQGD